ncbi:MAG: CotH kinase family protein [Eubacteriales bacterium]|nr:CotH kinase family protein [Eubacteriales bacterium]
MKEIWRKIRRRGYMPAFILFCAALLLAIGLYPRELAFIAPPQEYENNEVKNSRIIFSKPSGFYETAFTLWIKAPTKEIYYTLDGTDPVRGKEGTYAYDAREGIRIEDVTPSENVHSIRTDVTTGFDTAAVKEFGKEEDLIPYRVPEDPVDKCTILRAAFYSEEGERSEIQTGAYFIGYEGRKGYGGIKTVSVITDPANLFDYEKGIYVTGKTFDDFAAADSFHNGKIWYRHVWWWWDANYNRSGRDWERTANVQFFDSDGSLLLQQEAGIRIQGGGSRGFLPKSLNLYARRDYDGNTRFHYDFFGTGFEAKRLTLTTCGDDYYTKQKDRLVSELAEGQGFAVMHYEPCMLFLDGEFWGFYYLTEKYDEKYFSYYYGVPEEEVVEIKNNQIEVGTGEDLSLYEEMKAFIEESDMSVQENYERACELIDMDSFLNYYAVLIYCARCGDWPNGNFALWRTREVPEARTEGETGGSPEEGETGSAQEEGEADRDSDPARDSGPRETEESPYRDGRWRWVLFDVNSAAISPNLQEHDTLAYVRKNKSMRMFASLWANPGFREQFSERILEYGRTFFAPESVNSLLDGYETVMKDPMEIHYSRFFGEESGLDFSGITKETIRDFFAVRYAAVEKFLEDSAPEP